jgi:hypothetical protein
MVGYAGAAEYCKRRKDTECRGMLCLEKVETIYRKGMADMKKYVVCKQGGRIKVKCTDRNHDFGEIITTRDTLKEANLSAKVERMVLKHVERKIKNEAME